MCASRTPTDGKHSEDRLRGDDGQGDAPEPHESRLLEPRGRRGRRPSTSTSSASRRLSTRRPTTTRSQLVNESGEEHAHGLLLGPRGCGAGNLDCDQGNGADHNFVLSGAASEEGLRPVATLWSEKSGRLMKVWTTEPGVQFYTGNFLDGTLHGRSDGAQRRQVWAIPTCEKSRPLPGMPDVPPGLVHARIFPNIILRPGEAISADDGPRGSVCGVPVTSSSVRRERSFSTLSNVRRPARKTKRRPAAEPPQARRYHFGAVRRRDPRGFFSARRGAVVPPMPRRRAHVPARREPAAMAAAAVPLASHETRVFGVEHDERRVDGSSAAATVSGFLRDLCSSADASARLLRRFCGSSTRRQRPRRTRLCRRAPSHRPRLRRVARRRPCPPWQSRCGFCVARVAKILRNDDVTAVQE